MSSEQRLRGPWGWSSLASERPFLTIFKIFKKIYCFYVCVLAWVYMYHMWAGGHRGQKTVLKSVVSFHVAPGTRHAVAHRHTCKTNIHKHKIKTFSKMTNASTSTLHLNLRAKSLYTLGLSVQLHPSPTVGFLIPSQTQSSIWQQVANGSSLFFLRICFEKSKVTKSIHRRWNCQVWKGQEQSLASHQ